MYRFSKRAFGQLLTRWFTYSFIFIQAFSMLLTTPFEVQAVDNLVAAYNFNEGTGLTITDASGNNNQGTIAGATWNTGGKYGQALSFDGVNDWVTVTDSNSLDLTNGMTLEAWVRPTSSSGWRTVLLKEAPAELSYALYSNEDVARPGGWIRIVGTTGSSQNVAGTSTVPLNTWTHLTTTYDGSALKLYVNGTLVATRNQTGNMITTTGPLRLGGNQVWGEYYRGLLDDVRVYNRALTQAQIQADMATPVTSTPDTTAPTVNITNPTEATQVGGIVNVTASASDNIAVGGVQFYLNGNPLGAEDTAAPYSTNWDTTLGGNGPHSIGARARDSSGNTTQATTVNVTVYNAPKLTITAPTNGASLSGSTVNVTYTTGGDLTEVNHVHFKLDTNPEVMDMTFDGVYQFTNVPSGSHTLNGYLARINHSKIDGSDAAPISFSTTLPDTTAPTVNVTNPSEGATVSGTISVTATASDDVGVSGVQFLVDGNNLGSEDTTSPYSTPWNTTSLANGLHTVSARARDAANNINTSSVNVTVNNNNDPAQIGQWSAPFNLPIVAVHTVLLNSGKVLMWETGASAKIWDPATGAITDVPNNRTDLFCAGHTILADGRLLAIGGENLVGGLGTRDNNFFDPTTQTWSAAGTMTYRRWYPTGTMLGDGRVLAVSGADTSPSSFVPIPEIYNPVSNTWTTLPNASLSIPLYPLNFLLPNGKVFLAGTYEANVVSRVLDVDTQTWTVVDPTAYDAGSAVMYAPGKIMKNGKSANADPPTVPALANTYVIDMNQPNPLWRQTAPMNFPRAYHVDTLLPNGTTLVTGGGRNTDSTDDANGVLEAEIWSPTTEAWTTMARAQKPRLYHGSALLLPDGRVLVSGSGKYIGTNQLNAEIFSPPYLFKGARPTVTTTPRTIQHNRNFFVETPDGATITSVSLVRTGAMTHSFNADQRFVDLTFQQVAGGLTVQAPANNNIAPPGEYMLFLVNSSGVPSVGKFTRLPAPYEDSEPPTAPTNLTASGSVGSAALNWTAATDNTGVTRYNVHRSTTSGFSPTSANRVAQVTTTTFTDTGMTPGTYYYVVTAEDAGNNISPPSNEASAAVTADTIAPAVNVTNPTNGATVSGTITLIADASDNVSVGGVQFLLDGANLGSEIATAPYGLSWNSATVPNGSHTIAARARDAAGNVTTSANVTITTSNTQLAGLVAGYNFNQGAGTTVTDISGNSNTGTISEATWNASGKYGQALSFDGINDWVTVNDSNSLDLTNGMTLEAWVKPSSENGWRTVMLKEVVGELSYALYANEDVARPGGWIRIVGTTGSSQNVAGTSTLPLNTWTHLAATYDGSIMRLYVNGTQVATRNQTGNAITSTSPLRLGGNQVWGEYYAGLIDEVRIYNRALSQSEIQTDMNTPL